MRRILLFLLSIPLLGLVPPASGQVLVVEAGGAGRYFVEITVSQSGAITLRQLENVAQLGQPAEPPGDGDGGDLEADLAQVAYRALDEVEDPQRDRNAQRLAIGFREFASHIGTRFTPDAGSDAPWQHLATATAEMRRELLGDAYDAWKPWTNAVASQLSQQESDGQLTTAADMARAYREIADGLEYSPGELRKKLSPEVRALILQIVRLVLEHFFAQAQPANPAITA